MGLHGPYRFISTSISRFYCNMNSVHVPSKQRSFAMTGYMLTSAIQHLDINSNASMKSGV